MLFYLNPHEKKEMKNYIFGYGSLINLKSATKTLGRTIRDQDVFTVEAQHFSRIWRLVVPVIVDAYIDNPVNAVFLDIEKQHGKVINGIIIEVSLDELKNLDIREKNYNRVDITDYILPQIQRNKVYAYQGKPDFFAENFSNPKILIQYLNILHKGLEHQGKEFTEKFEKTTQSHSFEMINGFYKFLDKKQNIMTGRE